MKTKKRGAKKELDPRVLERRELLLLLEAFVESSIVSKLRRIDTPGGLLSHNVDDNMIRFVRGAHHYRLNLRQDVRLDEMNAAGHSDLHQVDGLRLGPRSRKRLSALGVTWVEELAHITADELLEGKNFSRTSLEEIRHLAREYGLKLKGE